MMFDIIVLGLSISLALKVDLALALLVWTLPQVAVSLIWSIAELITICVRRYHRGIHAGTHVALHLLLWLGFGVSVVLNAFVLASLVIYSNNRDDDMYLGVYDYYLEVGSGYIAEVQALVAFIALLMYVSRQLRRL